MPFPEWEAGMLMTAGRLNDRNVHLVDQGVNQLINDEGTLQATNIIIPADADAIYHVSLYAALRAATSADVIIAWDVPSGTTAQRFVNGPGASASGAVNDVTTVTMFPPAGAATESTVGGLGATTSVVYIEEIVFITGGVGGDITCQFAQDTAEASNAEFRAFSKALYRRIG